MRRQLVKDGLVSLGRGCCKSGWKSGEGGVKVLWEGLPVWL